MNKTTAALKLAEKTLRDIICVYKFETGTPVTALAAIREALAEPVTISCNCGDMYERNSFGGKFIQQYGCCPNCDAAEQDKQKPVAVISESAIGLVKLHSNGVSLPFGTQLYAAPVERQWVDLTDDEMWDVFINKDWTGEPLQLVSAVIAAFKEKNK